MTKKDNKVFIQIDNERIELTGNDLETFLSNAEQLKKHNEKRLSEEQLQKSLKVSAYTKLGLTEEEINAIL